MHLFRLGISDMSDAQFSFHIILFQNKILTPPDLNPLADTIKIVNPSKTQLFFP